MRSEEAINLHSNKNANHLLSIIAFRASRKGNPVLGVKPGEAFIGDYKKMGLTHREYRTAITNLVKWGYVTTITTNKGTIQDCTQELTRLGLHYPQGNQQGNHCNAIKLSSL